MAPTRSSAAQSAPEAAAAAVNAAAAAAAAAAVDAAAAAVDAATEPARGRRRAVAGRRSGAAHDGTVSDEELSAVAGRLPAFFAAFKQFGGPPPPEIIAAFHHGSVGPRHLRVLQLVAVEGPLSVSALAARLGVALATASLMVAELSRTGLVDRHEDDADRRRTIVGIAEGFREPVDDFVVRRLLPLRRALGRLVPEDRAALARGLAAIAEEFSGAGGPAAGCPGPTPHP